MVQIFGDFNDKLPPTREYLQLGFSPSSIPLQQRWRNSGLSANFLANYLANFFPSSNDAGQSDSARRKKQVREATTYVANDLLENAMKFNSDDLDYSISLQLRLYNDLIVLSVTNSALAGTMSKLQVFIEELINSDPQEMYFNALEKNAEDEESIGSSGSGLGLLTMINSYMVRLGWKFEIVQQEPQVVTITTMAQLPV